MGRLLVALLTVLALVVYLDPPHMGDDPPPAIKPVPYEKANPPATVQTYIYNGTTWVTTAGTSGAPGIVSTTGSAISCMPQYTCLGRAQ